MRKTLWNRKSGRGVKRTGMEAARALSVAAQMAMLCPSGVDIWMQRELSGCFELDRREASARR